MLTNEKIQQLAFEHLKAFAQFTGSGDVWFEGEDEFARAVEAATLATVTPLVQQLAKWKVGDRVISDGIHRDRPATITEVFIGFRYKLDEPHHLGHRQGWITEGAVYDTSGWRKLPATKESTDHG